MLWMKSRSAGRTAKGRERTGSCDGLIVPEEVRDTIWLESCCAG